MAALTFLPPQFELYNYDTDQTDSDPDLTTDERAIQYVPRYPGMANGGPARGIYQVSRLMGHSIMDSLIAALKAVATAAPTD